MTTPTESILSYLYNGTHRSFREIELSPQCIGHPRSTVWDHLLKLHKRGKVARVADVNGRNVKWYRVVGK